MGFQRAIYAFKVTDFPVTGLFHTNVGALACRYIFLRAVVGRAMYSNLLDGLRNVITIEMVAIDATKLLTKATSVRFSFSDLVRTPRSSISISSMLL